MLVPCFVLSSKIPSSRCSEYGRWAAKKGIRSGTKGIQRDNARTPGNNILGELHKANTENQVNISLKRFQILRAFFLAKNSTHYSTPHTILLHSFSIYSAPIGNNI